MSVPTSLTHLRGDLTALSYQMLTEHFAQLPNSPALQVGALPSCALSPERTLENAQDLLMSLGYITALDPKRTLNGLPMPRFPATTNLTKPMANDVYKRSVLNQLSQAAGVYSFIDSVKYGYRSCRPHIAEAIRTWVMQFMQPYVTTWWDMVPPPEMGYAALMPNVHGNGVYGIPLDAVAWGINLPATVRSGVLATCERTSVWHQFGQSDYSDEALLSIYYHADTDAAQAQYIATGLGLALIAFANTHPLSVIRRVALMGHDELNNWLFDIGRELGRYNASI